MSGGGMYGSFLPLKDKVIGWASIVYVIMTELYMYIFVYPGILDCKTAEDFCSTYYFKALHTNKWVG